MVCRIFIPILTMTCRILRSSILQARQPVGVEARHRLIFISQLHKWLHFLSSNHVLCIYHPFSCGIMCLYLSLRNVFVYSTRESRGRKLQLERVSPAVIKFNNWGQQRSHTLRIKTPLPTRINRKPEHGNCDHTFLRPSSPFFRNTGETHPSLYPNIHNPVITIPLDPLGLTPLCALLLFVSASTRIRRHIFPELMKSFHCALGNSWLIISKVCYILKQFLKILITDWSQRKTNSAVGTSIL